MRTFFKDAVFKLLIGFARIRIRRLRPFIIGISGSVGKTSTKEAVYHVLKSRFNVFRSKKSYNTEFGLPLAILGLESGFSSFWLWLKTVFLAGIKAYFGGANIQMMVLEMGTDKPGDMSVLLKIVQPQVGLITNIKGVHLGPGQFKDLEDIFNEKARLVESLPEKGIAILNIDDPYLLGIKDKLQCRKLFYGVGEIADLRVVKLSSSLQGLEFTLMYKDEVVDGKVALLGEFQIYVVLAAVAVAISQGFSLQEATDALADYTLPPGRMNLIPGIKDSTIIDSSYNSSPETLKEALDILKKITARRIAVIGNMNELGEYAENKHREIGRYVLDRADILVTVGDYAKLIMEEAVKSGFKSAQASHFDNTLEAAEFLKSMIKKGDAVLVKGSQNKMRLERVVKIIMKEPEKAGSLLVRQDWNS